VEIVARNRRWVNTLAKWPAVSPTLVVVAPVMFASVTALSTGCSLGDRTLSTIGQPAAEATDDQVRGLQGALRAGGHPEKHFAVTADQQAYLDALVDAGVHPSDVLMALSIGAYVCQARAAGQSEQAVWDFVLPLVRDDVDDADVGSVAPAVHEVDAATADYIRIATERLC